MGSPRTSSAATQRSVTETGLGQEQGLAAATPVGAAHAGNCSSCCCSSPAAAHLLQVLVTDDKLPLVGVLQLVGLDVLPQGLDDHGPGLRVDAQQPSQARIQLELGRLNKEHREVRQPRHR